MPLDAPDAAIQCKTREKEAGAKMLDEWDQMMPNICSDVCGHEKVLPSVSTLYNQHHLLVLLNRVL